MPGVPASLAAAADQYYSKKRANRSSSASDGCAGREKSKASRRRSAGNDTDSDDSNDDSFMFFNDGNNKHGTIRNKSSYSKSVVETSGTKRGVDLTLKLKSVLDEPNSFGSHSREVAKLREIERFKASVICDESNSPHSGKDTDDKSHFGAFNPGSEEGSTGSGNRRLSRREQKRFKVKDDVDSLMNFEVSQILEKSSFSSRDSSVVRSGPAKSRSCSRGSREDSRCSREGSRGSREDNRVSDSEERSIHEDGGSRSEDVSVWSTSKRSSSREGSKNSIESTGRRSRQGSSNSRRSHHTDTGSTITTPCDSVKKLPFDGNDAVSTPSNALKGATYVTYSSGAVCSDPPASINRQDDSLGRCYDISAIMSGRGVFRVGAGGSFKGEITKTKEEDSYIGPDDDVDGESLLESIVSDTTSMMATYKLVPSAVVSDQPVKTAVTASFSIHPGDLRESRITSFDSLQLQQPPPLASGMDPDTWCEFMSSDWFSGVVEAGAAERSREDDYEDDSSVVTDGDDGRPNIFKSAVKSCLCTPWRVPAAHM